jgi:type I restriction enzyme S subunit
MKPYPEYKPTGLAWLPEIPRHWTTRKIKYIFRERSEKGYPDEPLLAATQNHGVIPKSLYGARTVEAQKDLHLLKLVRVGDFVISLRSFQGGIEYAYYQGIISPAYTIMITDSCLIDSGYFRYLAKSPNFIALLQTCVTGIREGQNIDYSTLRRHSLPLPPADEQAQIVRYLDAITAKINKLIRAKKRQIALLQEQKQAIINQAVTRGLDPDVELKDSGIRHIGLIPKHWQVIKNQRLFKESVGTSTTGKEELLSVSLHYGVKKYAEVLAEERTATLQPSESLIGYKLVRRNDLVMNIMRARNGSLGFSKYDGIVSAAYCIYRLKIECNPFFLHYFFRTPMLSQIFEEFSCGIAEHRKRLYPDSFLSLKSILPPFHEQNVIVDFLKRQEYLLDNIISQYTREIELELEYKNALIAAVVTGKVDVRNIAVGRLS